MESKSEIGPREISSPGASARDEQVHLDLTIDEAWEVLSRCLESQDSDGPILESALMKIANAAKAQIPEPTNPS